MKKLKTKWPPTVSPKAQVRKVLQALASEIGEDAIEGLAVFVRYDDGSGSTINAVFTGGAEVDDVYAWAKSEISDGD